MNGTSQPAAASQATTSDNRGASETEQDAAYDPWAIIKELFPQTYSDRTGRTALRNFQKQVGWFEPEAQISLRIKSPSRGDILIHLDLDIAGLVAELTGQQAEISPTRSGHALRARMKKITPAAVEFGDMNSSRGSTENTTKKEGFNV